MVFETENNHKCVLIVSFFGVLVLMFTKYYALVNYSTDDLNSKLHDIECAIAICRLSLIDEDRKQINDDLSVFLSSATNIWTTIGTNSFSRRINDKIMQ